MKNPFNKIFPYSRQFIDQSDIKNVVRVLKSGFLTQGPEILKTEKKIAKFVGSKYAVLTSSCSSGLHIACKALQLKKNSNILTSPITFVSTATSALHCKYKVLIGDIDKNSLMLSNDDIEKNINVNNIKLVIPVHFAGAPYDIKRLTKIRNKKNLKIIEDAAHAFGALYKNGDKIGSCKHSDMTVFSFHPVKIIAGGEGGVVTTNSKELYNRLLELRSHGINKDPNEKFQNKKEGYTGKQKNLWFYEMKELGFNYRQTDIHSALINSQIDKISKFLKYRKKLVKKYDNWFKDLKNVKITQQHLRNLSSHHLYILKINFEKIKISRNDFMKRLRSKGIITQVHYIPLYIHPYFQKNSNFKVLSKKNSDEYYQKCLSIPVYYNLKSKEQKYIFNQIKFLVQNKGK
tara:strand:+ start:412 stop:1620 length:1209 start_codon:yes stop_codon:yes gene_type:complete